MNSKTLQLLVQASAAQLSTMKVVVEITRRQPASKDNDKMEKLVKEMIDQHEHFIDEIRAELVKLEAKSDVG